MIEEVYCMEKVKELVSKGYKIQRVYTKKEYAYNHSLEYTTLHDAYTAYIMVKHKKWWQFWKGD